MKVIINNNETKELMYNDCNSSELDCAYQSNNNDLQVDDNTTTSNTNTDPSSQNYINIPQKLLADSQSAWTFFPQTPIQSTELFLIFESCINQQGYEIIERQPLEAIAVKTSKKGIVDLMKLCVPCLNNNSKHISFKFVITEAKTARVEKFEFKSLTGTAQAINQ